MFTQYEKIQQHTIVYLIIKVWEYYKNYAFQYSLELVSYFSRIPTEFLIK